MGKQGAATLPTEPLVFGAIADDLTGGLELASMLVARGVRTGFTIGAGTPISADGALADCDAHVIALKTRVIPVGDAVAQVLAAAEALLARGARQVFFKYCATFDSTPAGNIGPCAEALMDRLGATQALFCPALCETGRTVYQGHMFGGAQLLSESPKRHDPLTPMTDANLVRVLQAQSRRRAGLLSHATVDAGADAIRARCRELGRDGQDLLIADTLYERDLAVIAQAAADMPLFTGNSSVAAHLPPVWLKQGLVRNPSPARLPGIEGPGAVLVGSVAEQTLGQLAEFGRDHPVLTLDLARSFAGADLAGEAIAFAKAAIAQGRSFAVSTAAPQSTVGRLQAEHGRSETAARAERTLSEIARALVGELGVRRLIVAGGETSGAVVAALGIARIEAGPYQGPGLSRGIVPGPRPLSLMLKSGKLGSPGIFATVLDDMRRPLEVAPLLDRWPPAASATH